MSNLYNKITTNYKINTCVIADLVQHKAPHLQLLVSATDKSLNALCSQTNIGGSSLSVIQEPIQMPVVNS